MGTRVLFDLYGVFLTHGVEDSVARLTELLKVDAAQQFHKAYLEFRSELEAGNISDERWWQQLALQPGVGVEEASDISRVLDSVFELNEEGLEMAMAVMDAGFVTGVCANISPGLAHMVRDRCQWLDEFAAVIFSCDIGVCKPHPEAFSVASEALGGAGKDTVYFDRDEDFVQAAKEAGLKAYTYPSPQKVLALLDDLKP